MFSIILKSVIKVVFHVDSVFTKIFFRPTIFLKKDLLRPKRAKIFVTLDFIQSVKKYIYYTVFDIVSHFYILLAKKKYDNEYFKLLLFS